MGQPLHGSNSFGLSTHSLTFFNETQYITAQLETWMGILRKLMLANEFAIAIKIVIPKH